MPISFRFSLCRPSWCRIWTAALAFFAPIPLLSWFEIVSIMTFRKHPVSWQFGTLYLVRLKTWHRRYHHSDVRSISIQYWICCLPEQRWGVSALSSASSAHSFLPGYFCWWNILYFPYYFSWLARQLCLIFVRLKYGDGTDHACDYFCFSLTWGQKTPIRFPARIPLNQTRQRTKMVCITLVMFILRIYSLSICLQGLITKLRVK